MIEGLIPRGTNEDRRDEKDRQVLHISEFNREAHMLFSVLHPVSYTGAISQISRCGIPKATQRRSERKETRTERGEIADCLLASAFASRAVISVSPRPRAPPAR